MLLIQKHQYTGFLWKWTCSNNKPKTSLPGNHDTVVRACSHQKWTNLDSYQSTRKSTPPKMMPLMISIQWDHANPFVDWKISLLCEMDQNPESRPYGALCDSGQTIQKIPPDPICLTAQQHTCYFEQGRAEQQKKNPAGQPRSHRPSLFLPKINKSEF